MFNFSKIKVLVFLLFILLTFFWILPTRTADAVDAVDVIKNSSNFYFLGPTAIPAGIAISGLQFLEIVPEPKEGSDDFIFSSIIKSVVVLMQWVSNSLLSFGTGILSYVVEGGFTGMQVTNFDSESENYNPLVETGWGIARNLANAALVIGLIIIAINIILGREENKAKKTLINFIIIALLINFTPVLCGFVIDGSNIITKSFMTGGINTNLNDLINKSWNELEGDDINVVFFSGISLCIFTVYSFYIYILYALLFAARYVMLWILVMASPIAFATKVFPQSKYIKKIFPSILYWDDWLESFAQWCVIGIPAGLFIYLSNIMMQNAPTIYAASNSTNDIIGGIIGGLFVYFIPLLFLLAGFFISISAGGQVGSYLGGVAKNSLGKITEKAKAGGTWMYEGGKGIAIGSAVGGLSGISEGLSSIQAKGYGAGLKDTIVGGTKGFISGAGAEGREKAAKQIAEIKEGIGWTKRGDYASKIKGDIDESQKRMGSLSDDDREAISLSPGLTRQAQLDSIGAFNNNIEKGKLTDKQLEYLTKNKNWAEKSGVNLKDAAKARPEYAQRLVNKSAYDVVNGMNPADAGKTINSNSWSQPSVLLSAHPNTIAGKIKKGSAEDIKNMKTGLIAELNNIFSQIPNTHFPTVTEDNLVSVIEQNRTILENHIDNNLMTSTLPENQRRGTTLAEILNHAQDGII
jgi:hypothetical protein